MELFSTSKQWHHALMQNIRLISPPNCQNSGKEQPNQNKEMKIEVSVNEKCNITHASYTNLSCIQFSILNVVFVYNYA